MERPCRLLLVVGLLAAALPAATARAAPTCKPALLATQVSLFCSPDTPTSQCCEPVLAVDLGGGVPCLCRVAAEPQLVITGLNATHLLTLYTSCGGLRPGGAHLAAASEGRQAIKPLLQAKLDASRESKKPGTRSRRCRKAMEELVLGEGASFGWRLRQRIRLISSERLEGI